VGASHDHSAKVSGDNGKVNESDELFVIRTFWNDVEARLAESVLDANGIDCTIIADNAGGMLPYLNAMHPIRLVVKKVDVDTAIALLDSTSELSDG
jgi:hypothetical protein